MSDRVITKQMMYDQTLTSGGDSCGDPPVPIPNTVVKPTYAESTWLETAWEDR